MGAASGSHAQQVHPVHVLHQANREQLLEDAGILPKGLDKCVGQAIKADLQL